MFFKYIAMLILVLATLRQTIRASVMQNSKEDDKFVYTFFVTMAFFMTQMGVI